MTPSPDRAQLLEDLPRRPRGLQGVIRRAIPISRLEARTRKRLAASARALGSRLDRRLESSGVLARLDRDAATWRERRGLKGPIGRGGTPLGPDHRRELQRIFETEGLEFFAQLIEGEMGAWALDVEAILKEQYLEAYNAGGAGAQKKLGIRPNFKLRNPGILEALAERANMLSGGFSDDMFDRLRTVVAEEFFILGEHPFQVAASLQDEFAFLSKSRAQLIARTETLTIVEQAQHATYKASGVQLKRWLTTLDSKERFAHFKAHGQIKGIDEPFELTDEEGVTEQLQYPGDPSAEPGNICNCRCLAPWTRIDGGTVIAATRSEYVGPMLEILTRSGRKITVTPNHPVLTAKGFLPAGALRQGNKLIGYSVSGKSRGERFALADKDKAPPSIEEIFGTLEARAAVVRIKPAPLDFHGDARFIQGKVDMVRADPFLRLDRDAALDQFILEHPLVRRIQGADLDTTTLESFGNRLPRNTDGLRDGKEAHALEVGAFNLPPPVEMNKAGNPYATSLFHSSHRNGVFLQHAGHDFMGYAHGCGEIGATLTAEIPSHEFLVGNGMWPLDTLRVGRSTETNAVAFEHPRNSGETDSEAVGNQSAAFPCQVAADDVIFIREYMWSGHVYDLQTGTGLIAADGIIVHNCDFIPIVSEGQLLEPSKVWDGDNDPDEFSQERLAEEAA